jgi:hypothetical protein
MENWDSRIGSKKLGLFFLLLLAIGLKACLEQTAQLPAPSLNGHVNEQPGLIVRIEEIIIRMLLVSALVGLITQRIGVPYTIGLVVVGFALSFLPQIAPSNITPDIILALLVPPLVYEAAFLLNYSDLRQDLAGRADSGDPRRHSYYASGRRFSLILA